jgi:hypothetical protein
MALQQSKFPIELISAIRAVEFVVLCVIAENYSYTLQDEVEG